MAKKKVTVKKIGMTPGNRQYSSVLENGVRKTVVYHPHEGARMKKTIPGKAPTKSTMAVVNDPHSASGSIKKGPTKPAVKVSMPYKGGTVRVKK
jgi:hypothetical protein